jgi:hypothetical protein
MNWKPEIFKPGWELKDPAVRREAVATEDDPELIASLGSICLEDEDPGVRGVAARRLTDLGILSTASGREQDKTALKTITERMRQLAAASGSERAPLEQRREVVATSEDRELLEAVARSAPEAELRIAALKKISRQGFLGDRAIGDPDPDIRRIAAAAITQHSTLRRVIEETRTTDKALHQDLEERLHNELLAAGDQQAIERESLAICMAIEQAAVGKDKVDAAQVKAFEKRWSQVEGRARPEHQSRFERDLARLSQDDRQDESPEEQEETEPVPEPESPQEAAQPEAPPPAAGPASAILSEAAQVLRDYAAKRGGKLVRKKVKGLEANWNAAWASIAEPNQADLDLASEARSLVEKLQTRLEAATAKRDELLARAAKLVEELRNDLEEGELHKALELRLELQKLGKKLSGEPRWKGLTRQINSMQGRLRELRGWQHWSNNRIRKSMIKEMEALPLADLHPDAVLDRIKELQARWKDLEQSEQIPGDKHFAAAPWMWRKFNAAGRQAFEATKPFLDKRSEIQKKHLDSMRALADNISELARSETPDWPDLAKAIRTGRQEMRSLGEVPARARHKMAQKLKAALETANTAMQAHYEVVEKAKLKLIREAAQLAHVADRDEAISKAKSLQAEWKAAGSLWRSREDQLWREFRQPLDPLFENLKAEQQSVREQRDALLADQKALCTSLESLLELDDAALPAQHGRVQGLKDAWKDIRHPERRLQQKFQKTLGLYQDRLDAQERKAESATRDAWWDKADLLHQAESAALTGKLSEKLKAKLQKAWPDTQSVGELDQLLDQRFESVTGDEPILADESNDHTEEKEAARKQCICLEFLAGVSSPEEEKDLRMQYQVDRLSESLSGERRRMSAVEEAKMLEAEWLALPCIPDSEYDIFKRRVKSALDSILET